MPYPNEMSARLLDPDLFETCRRTERESEGKKYGVLTCKYKKGKTPEGKSDWAEQSYRYNIEIWTEAEAKAHCEKAGGTFEPAEEEVKIKSTDVYMFASPVSLKEGEHTVDIEILREGSWKHPKAPNGILTLTKARIQEFIKNFEAEVTGDELPLDIDHEGPTIGWLKKLWIKSVDGLAHLWAHLDITDEETQKQVKNGSLKYFSPQIITDYEDSETGKTYDVVRSGALTSWPFIKNMKPAVVNFSEIRDDETTPDRKDQLRLVENQRDQAINGSKILLKEVKRLIDQVRLKDRKIEDLKLEFDLTELLQNGQATPFELQEARTTAQKDPQQVQFWLKRTRERPKNPVGSQLSILVPRRAKGGIGSIIELLEKEADPEKHAKILKLATEAIEEQKEKRGLR